MKQLTCEMCGSTDMMKQDGVFVCQSCGTKYSAEEAKKMMVEGTVDVSGSTIKVDNTELLDNYYRIAKNAYDSNNLKEAEDYCNKIIEVHPDNYQAWLLKGRAAGWQSTIAKIRIEESVNCFEKAVDNSPEEEKETVKKESAMEIEKLSKALIKQCCDNYENHPSANNVLTVVTSFGLAKKYTLTLLMKCGVLANILKKDIATMISDAAMRAWNYKILRDYQNDDHPSDYTFKIFLQEGNGAIAVLQCAIDACSDDSQADIQRYKKMIEIKNILNRAHSVTYSNGGYHTNLCLNKEAKEKNIDDIMKWHQKIKEIDPSYKIPPRPAAPQHSGCYVATAVYGSYDCPQVWTLRRYRDDTLAKTWYGRAFIHTYYTVSPTLVKWFGDTKWFQKMWKGKLDRMVAKLQSQGVESTPYEDQEW